MVRNAHINTECSEILAWGREGAAEEESKTCAMGVLPSHQCLGELHSYANAASAVSLCFSLQTHVPC